MTAPETLRAAAMLLIFIAALHVPRTVHAQSTPVYRCGTLYTQFPCSLDARALTLESPPEAAARQISARTADDEARWAARMRAERLAAEARTRPAMAVSIGPSAFGASVEPLPRKGGKRAARQAQSGGQGAEFVAILPAPPKARKAVK